LVFLVTSDPPYFLSDLLESALRLLKNFLGLTTFKVGSGIAILGAGLASWCCLFFPTLNRDPDVSSGFP